MKIIPLSEGSFTIDKTKQFVPFDDVAHELNDRPTGSLLVEIQPFLVVTSKDILLLDTGLGFNDTAEDGMQLMNNIAKAGYATSDITKVLMTHLHKDHAGGVTLSNNHHETAFPNATYYLQRREMDFAMEKGMPSFVTDELTALQSATNVEWLTEDSGTIDGYIRYQHTGAHSPHHQVFWIEEDGEKIFFGGDDAPQLQQMKVRYKTKYDHDPEKAMNLRLQWWEEGAREGWTFLFYHDINCPSFKKG